MGLFSLLHCGEDTAVCVIKCESSETEELVERNETEELNHNIHIDRHKYPPPAVISSTSHTHKRNFSTIFSNFQTLLAAFFH